MSARGVHGAVSLTEAKLENVFLIHKVVLRINESSQFPAHFKDAGVEARSFTARNRASAAAAEAVFCDSWREAQTRWPTSCHSGGSYQKPGMHPVGDRPMIPQWRSHPASLVYAGIGPANGDNHRSCNW